MWLFFAVLSLFFYAAADIFGKKSVNEGDVLTPTELFVSSTTLYVFAGVVLYVLRLGESGLAPWQLVWQNPLIIVNVLCYFLQGVLYLLSMRYIKLSIAEAISGSSAVFYFVGLLLLNVVLGKFPAAREMLHPLRLIPILLVVLFIVLYPNVEQIGAKRTGEALADFKQNRRRFCVGLFLLLLSQVFDSCDSLMTGLLIDKGTIGAVDYMIMGSLTSAFVVMGMSVFLRIQRGKWFIPFVGNTRFSNGYCVAAYVSSVLFIVASYRDAVRTGILFLAYPIVPIIGAKVFLKETYTWRQNVCIWTITASAIAFCALDYLL